MTDAERLRKLDSRLAKAEGLKHEASIGDVREIRRIVCEELATELENSWGFCRPLYEAMVLAGKRSLSKKK